MATKEWPCTAEQIVELRDTQAMSWKAVALELGLGNSGGVARRAYTDLTGIPHYESRPLGGRVPAGVDSGSVTTTRPLRRSRAASSVVWTDDSDQEEMEEALRGERQVDNNGNIKWVCKRVAVRHSLLGHEWTEEVPVRYATAFTFGPEGDQELQVSVIEDLAGATRTFFVSSIQAVR